MDVKTLHAKIGQLTLENDFLEGALTRAGLLSKKRCSTANINLKKCHPIILEHQCATGLSPSAPRRPCFAVLGLGM